MSFAVVQVEILFFPFSCFRLSVHFVILFYSLKHEYEYADNLDAVWSADCAMHTSVNQP